MFSWARYSCTAPRRLGLTPDPLQTPFPWGSRVEKRGKLNFMQHEVQHSSGLGAFFDGETSHNSEFRMQREASGAPPPVDPSLHQQPGYSTGEG